MRSKCSSASTHCLQETTFVVEGHPLLLRVDRGKGHPDDVSSLHSTSRASPIRPPLALTCSSRAAIPIRTILVPPSSPDRNMNIHEHKLPLCQLCPRSPHRNSHISPRGSRQSATRASIISWRTLLPCRHCDTAKAAMLPSSSASHSELGFRRL